MTLRISPPADARTGRPPRLRPRAGVAQALLLAMLTAALLPLPLAIGAAEAAPPAAAPAASAAPLVAGNIAFALALFERLRQRPGNLFFSPYSLSNALAMAAAGARGATAREMAQVLHRPPGSAGAFGRLNAELAERARADGARLQVASALWPAERFGLRPAYATTLRRDFGATITPLDFGGDPERARATINGWVERNTGDRIRDLIAAGALASDTEMVLVNAIAFQADWERPFEPDRTVRAPFHAEGRRPVMVPTLQRTGTYRIARVPGGRLLELPYAGDRLSLLLLLPTRRNGLAELERRLSPGALQTWRKGLQERTVALALPRFRLAWQADDLTGTLRALGMATAFSSAADFGGIAAGRGPRLSGVVHKAWVEVNEQGTEAAAATGLVMVTGMLDEPVEPFRAEHPFLFLIQDRISGSLLFLGRLDDPTADSG